MEPVSDEQGTSGRLWTRHGCTNSREGRESYRKLAREEITGEVQLLQTTHEKRNLTPRDRAAKPSTTTTTTELQGGEGAARAVAHGQGESHSVRQVPQV